MSKKVNTMSWNVFLDVVEQRKSGLLVESFLEDVVLARRQL